MEMAHYQRALLGASGMHKPDLQLEEAPGRSHGSLHRLSAKHSNCVSTCTWSRRCLTHKQDKQGSSMEEKVDLITLACALVSLAGVSRHSCRALSRVGCRVGWRRQIIDGQTARAKYPMLPSASENEEGCTQMGPLFEAGCSGMPANVALAARDRSTSHSWRQISHREYFLLEQTEV